MVANGLSAMIVQAGAVPRVLDAGHTAAAEQSFLVIEETGRDALAEMRRLLGVLRRDDEAADLAPQPGLGRARRPARADAPVGARRSTLQRGGRARAPCPPAWT